MRQRYKCYFTILLVMFLFLTATYSAAAVSDLEKQVSKRNMELYTEEYGIADLDAAEQNKIDKMFQRLTSEAQKDAPNLEFQYRVIDAPVMNAAYLGAGRVILFKGLVEQVENHNQLAAIIAHELGHGVNGDISKKLDWIRTIQLGTLLADLAGDGEINEDDTSRITAIALNLMQKKYSRTQEKAADYYSVFLTERAGYDPLGAVGVMKLLKEKSEGPTDSELLEIFAEHPNLDKRIDYLSQLVTKVEAVDKYYYSPIATARRFTKGLLEQDMEQVYAAHSEQIQKQLSLAQFKERKQLTTIRREIDKFAEQSNYQIDLRNQVEGTARVAVLFEKNNDPTLGLALDLKKGDYGWKIANEVKIY